MDTQPAPSDRILYDSCPLCLSGNFELLREADCSHHVLFKPVISKTMRWMRCRSCAHVFTDGYFTPEAEAAIFCDAHGYQQVGKNFEQQRYVSARMVERVARNVQTGKWLDVGFGNGSLLLTAEEWGFTPIGLDLRPTTVEKFKSLGFDARCQDITDVTDLDDVAVVSMADVLEHMPYPMEGLSAAHDLMQPNGILLVSMPNFNCAAWRLLDKDNVNPYWGELEHFHNFSRDRLYKALDAARFEPLAYGVSERYRVCMEIVARRR